MTDYTKTSEQFAAEQARKKPKASKKRIIGWSIGLPLAALVLLIGGILIAPYAKAHVAAAVAPTVTAADAIADEAKTLDAEYVAICSDPAWDEGLALVAGTGSGEAMDSITGACTDLGKRGQAYVTKVEAATSIWTNIGDGFGEVTDTVRAAVAAGDIETAIRILFAQSEEAE
ncbi:hypothetical protein [Microbacterium oxydans]|nr:hypothetical protein [Microbacterium oxydans]